MFVGLPCTNRFAKRCNSPHDTSYAIPEEDRRSVLKTTRSRKSDRVVREMRDAETFFDPVFVSFLPSDLGWCHHSPRSCGIGGPSAARETKPPPRKPPQLEGPATRLSDVKQGTSSKNLSQKFVTPGELVTWRRRDSPHAEQSGSKKHRSHKTLPTAESKERIARSFRGESTERKIRASGKAVPSRSERRSKRRAN